MKEITVECIKSVHDYFKLGEKYKAVWDEDGSYYHPESFVAIDEKSEKHVIAQYTLGDEWFLEHFKIISDEYFKHYKGGIYKVLHNAIHTENNDDLVIYSDEYGNIWARPVEVFYGFVEISTKVRRFERI